MSRRTYKSKTESKDSKFSKKNVKGKGVKKFDEANLDTKGRDNDPNWYFTSSELANQAAQLSFQNVLGFGDVIGYKVPSIVRVDLAMCPGVTESSNEVDNTKWPKPSMTSSSYAALGTGKSGVNLMAAKLYTTLSSFTGRTASYAPQDVAMMILAISSIAEFSETIRRIMGLALTYSYRNRTLPLGIIRSMGVDSNDLMANLSIYRMNFNVAMSRINQIPLLENISYIKKARDMYQKVYMDDPTDMSQIFYYFPATWGYLDEGTDEHGSVLRMTPIRSSGQSTGYFKLSSMLNNLNTMITKVLESSTLNFIYADLLNMANKLNVKTWKFDYLAENYVVMPEYNANALLQFHNLTIVGYPKGAHNAPDQKTVHTVDLPDALNPGDDVAVKYTDGYDIFSDADANNVVYNPVFVVTNSGPGKDVIVDMPSSNPTIEDRIEALRFAATWSGVAIDATTLGTSFSGATCFALPDHWAVAITIYDNIDYNNTGASLAVVGASSNVYQNVSAEIAARLSQMEHAPIFYNPQSDYLSAKLIVGALQYYTTVNHEYVQRLLDIMYVGLFDFRV